MKVRWTKEGLEDRIIIWDYLAERNPVAAVALDELFNESAARLADHPHGDASGRKWR